MVSVRAEAMSPTIIHAATFDGDMARSGGVGVTSAAAVGRGVEVGVTALCAPW